MLVSSFLITSVRSAGLVPAFYGELRVCMHLTNFSYLYFTGAICEAKLPSLSKYLSFQYVVELSIISIRCSFPELIFKSASDMPTTFRLAHRGSLSDIYVRSRCAISNVQSTIYRSSTSRTFRLRVSDEIGFCRNSISGLNTPWCKMALSVYPDM